ncbi:MAG TPA: hypothetical protein VF827_03120, partial [Syntrophales bacterium]
KFVIKADTAEGRAALEKFSAAMEKLGPEAEKSSTQASSGIMSMSGAWKLAGAAAAAAGVAILATIGYATKLGMEAVESENLFNVSMGAMADEARKWSQELSDSLGLNEFELRKSVGTFNVMLSSMGLATDQAYSMSTSLTKLAYDMASFYNLKPEEAFDKLRAGISGESEPLKRLGIVVNETTTQIWALKHGLIAQGEEMSEQTKILARYGVIMDQTKAAQGDLARTMDSPANAIRILKSSVEELLTKLGMAFLPVLQSLVGMLNEVAKGLETDGSTIQGFAKLIAGPLVLFFDWQTALSAMTLKMEEWYKALLETALGVDKLMSSLNPFYKSVAPEIQKQLDEVQKAMIQTAKTGADWEMRSYKLQKAVEAVGQATDTSRAKLDAHKAALDLASQAAQVNAKETARLTSAYLSGKIEIGAFEMGLKQLLEPAKEATAEEKKLAKQTQELKEKWQEDWLKRANQDVEDHAKALKSVNDEMAKALRPADEMVSKLRLAIEAGKTEKEIVTAFGKELIDVAAKQREVNKELGV